ncbi:MAG TPA: peptide chain release factor N(5)-glutamine methyltransferase [Solirubrobacteraceae bacterium]|nr:peptide chain release factor N(5)-glutamine methyltransferase [Solirubrobacteraceae bacterium]
MTTRSAVSVRDALDGAITAIDAGGSPSARLDAELLLADALGTTREQLYSDPAADVRGPAVRAFQSHVRRRAVEREPVAYIVGHRAFRRLDLAVDSRVLVPRPETELLVELALGLAVGARVLDCCCGSGAVALALKDERPDLAVSGSDVDAAALAVAAANGARLRLEVSWRLADLLDGLPDAYDAIVANPPYVDSATIATLEPEVSRHEPRTALDGGPGGLEKITQLIGQAALTAASIVILEHGEGQAEAVAARCRAAGYPHVTHHHDLAQIARAVVARR